MKLSKAILIIFFAVIFQTSFVRLNGFLPVSPDIPVIALFLFSYSLSFADILVLSLVTGIFIDLFSSVGFGISAFVLVIVFSADFFLRENIFRAKTRGEFIFSSFFIFSCYYPAVIALNHFLKAPQEAGFIDFLLGKRLIEEMLLNFFLGLIFYYLFFLYPRKSERKSIFER